jgi:hypothetical protein
MIDYPPLISTLLKDVNVIVQTLAIIVGATWAYVKYFRGRVFRPKLEPTISGACFVNNTYIHVIITCSLKNVGLSKISLEEDGTGIRISSCAPQDTLIVQSAVWDHHASFPVFLDKHKWIEPGETICEKRLIKLNREKRIGLLLELQVYTKKITWHAMDIIALAELDEKITSGEIAVISTSHTLQETVE